MGETSECIGIQEWEDNRYLVSWSFAFRTHRKVTRVAPWQRYPGHACRISQMQLVPKFDVLVL
jgi:hypothetical protein